jgi:hypothetical protein
MSTRILAVAVSAALQVTLVVEAAHAGVPVNVPEPTTLALLGAGAAVVAIGAWWKHRK